MLMLDITGRVGEFALYGKWSPC